MENINSNINSSQENQEVKNEIQINKININPNQEEHKNNNFIEINEPLEKQNQAKNNFNIKNKYDYALLEELNNTKTRSWRIDLMNGTQEEEIENKNKSKENNINDNQNIINEKNDINKNDRFKDFDEILLLEENKDKKKKNMSKEILEPNEKEEKVENSNIERSQNKNEKENIEQRLSQENNNNIIIKNSSTLSELNKFIENRDYNYNYNEKVENKNNDINNINKNSMLNFKNQKKSSNLSSVINENSNNSNEKNNNNDIYKNINLEYSEDKKSFEQIDAPNKINNKIENIKNNFKKMGTLYNNFFDLNDKAGYNDYENDKNINILNRNLFGKKNNKEINEINNKKINKQFHVSKSCNYLYNNNRKFNNENNFIIPNKSQNIRKNLVCDKNTINIQLSIQRKTRSANDIKKHMSYYLMDRINKNPKNEINKFEGFINKVESKLNYNSNNRLLNTFLSLQVSSSKINSKNSIKYISTPYNIHKNSFSDKIKRKINNINLSKKYKNVNYIIKNNNYVNLEFFEESKQDSFFDKTTKNNKLFKNNNNLFQSNNNNSNNFYNEKNNQENKLFFSNSKISKSKDNINNYLFRNYTTNMNQKRSRSFFSHNFKSTDFYQEKNEIFGTNFNYNINQARKFEFKYDESNTNKLFNTTKNILYPKMPSSKSSNSIFQSKIKDKDKHIYSNIYNSIYNQRNYRNNLINRNTNTFYTKF